MANQPNTSYQKSFIADIVGKFLTHRDVGLIDVFYIRLEGAKNENQPISDADLQAQHKVLMTILEEKSVEWSSGYFVSNIDVKLHNIKGVNGIEEGVFVRYNANMVRVVVAMSTVCLMFGLSPFFIRVLS